MTIQRNHIKGVQENDKLSDKEKLTNIKKSLNIIELKKSVEKALNDVLQHIRKP